MPNWYSDVNGMVFEGNIDNYKYLNGPKNADITIDNLYLSNLSTDDLCDILSIIY